MFSKFYEYGFTIQGCVSVNRKAFKREQKAFFFRNFLLYTMYGIASE
jgi:hypothetical protein